MSDMVAPDSLGSSFTGNKILLPKGYDERLEESALTPVLPTEKGRVSTLDAVRAIAVLGVIGTHSLSATVAVTQSYDIPKPVFMLFDYGQFGVPVFFALSGWLIFSLYYRTTREVSSKHYWARRIARIWPLWALFVIVYFILYPIDTSGLPTWWAIVLALIFMGWTVSTLVAVPSGGLTIQQEMFHYSLFWLFRRRGVDFFLGSVIVGYLSFYLANWLTTASLGNSLVSDAVSAWLRLSLFTSWPLFVMGGLGYLAFTRWRANQSTGQLSLSPRTGILLLIALLIGSQIMYAQETPGYFVFGFVIFSALLGIAIDRIPGVNAVFWSIGRYSYFMYFFHFLVLRQLESVYRNTIGVDPSTSPLWNLAVLGAMFVASTIISWTVAWVSWRIFESPILRFARIKFR
jgi:peptidoglycan/LPS O-acetylase OafA/YrhL